MTSQLTVTSRFSGAALFTASIDAPEGAPFATRLGLAVLWALENGADLYGANLTGADLTRADLTGANLTGANLTGANLTRANLTRANLYGANLTRADLTGADLTGAKVRDEEVSRLIAQVQRMQDPYTFLAFELAAGGVKVMAGCRWFTIEEYRAHVAAQYADAPKGRETLDILAFIEARATHA